MRTHHTFAVVVAVFLAQIAVAQPPPGQGGPPRGAPIAGTVKSVSADKLVLATAKGDVTIALTPQTRVTEQRPVSASDIKAGSYLGTSNQNASAPNSGTATEVHLADNGPNVNFPMNSSGLMMTNGHVKSVTPTAGGQEMEVDYGQGTTRHVVVPAGTRVTKMADLDMSALKPNVAVRAMTTKGPDGTQSAAMIMVDSGAAPAP
jgi:hypothetical protein